MEGRETAPGPGRSPFASTVLSKVGGMQKTLTLVTLAAPVATHALGDVPLWVIVFADPDAKAPEVRCRQRRQDWVPVLPQPVVNELQSLSSGHASPTQFPPPRAPPQPEMPWQTWPAFGPPAAQWPRKLTLVEPDALPQLPQNTAFEDKMLFETLVPVPVVRLKRI